MKCSFHWQHNLHKVSTPTPFAILWTNKAWGEGEPRSFSFFALYNSQMFPPLSMVRSLLNIIESPPCSSCTLYMHNFAVHWKVPAIQTKPMYASRHITVLYEQCPHMGERAGNIFLHTATDSLPKSDYKHRHFLWLLIFSHSKNKCM